MYIYIYIKMQNSCFTFNCFPIQVLHFQEEQVVSYDLARVVSLFYCSDLEHLLW